MRRAPAQGAAAQAGFSLVELLISMAILGVILGIVGNYLTAQWRLADQTEARNEMQVNLRSAMEMVSGDLYNAGSVGVAKPCTPATPALEAVSTSARSHTLTVRYCDTYKVAPKVVTYAVQADPDNANLKTLFRNGTPAIPGIIGLEVVLTCKPGTSSVTSLVNPTCKTGFSPADVLSGTLKLAAQSPRKARQVSMVYTFAGTAVGGADQQDGYYYEYAEQSVRTPNLGK